MISVAKADQGKITIADGNLGEQFDVEIDFPYDFSTTLAGDGWVECGGLWTKPSISSLRNICCSPVAVTGIVQNVLLHREPICLLEDTEEKVFVQTCIMYHIYPFVVFTLLAGYRYTRCQRNILEDLNLPFNVKYIGHYLSRSEAIEASVDLVEGLWDDGLLRVTI